MPAQRHADRAERDAVLRVRETDGALASIESRQVGEPNPVADPVGIIWWNIGPFGSVTGPGAGFGRAVHEPVSPGVDATGLGVGLDSAAGRLDGDDPAQPLHASRTMAI